MLKLPSGLGIFEKNMSYQIIREISEDLLEEAGRLTYVRSQLFDALTPPKQNVVILRGARGIGKSTLLLQFLLKQKQLGEQVLYVSADSTLLNSSLTQFAYDYQKRGGTFLAIDEIHKYDNWQAEIKTILDSFPSLKIIVSGSSSIGLDYATADLSRRHVMLSAKGLSFREYIEKNYFLKFPVHTLNSIIENAVDQSNEIVNFFKKNALDLLKIFKDYLRAGYFISRENYLTDILYYDSLQNTINSVIDADIAYAHPEIDTQSKQKIKLLLKFIAQKCPFTPNVSELSRSLSLSNDNTLKKYLFYLHEGEILHNLYAANKSYKDFQKPQKILLSNTNYVYGYTESPLIGTVRETFAANCLQITGELTAPTTGDFCVNGEWVFEIGGRSKNKRQIKSYKRSYVFADEILSVENDNLPLWLLGFLW